MIYTWTTPIRYVRGLGPTRSRELTKINIHTVGDLLEYPPLSYIYPGVTPINEASDGMVVVKAKVVEIGRRYGHVIGATVCDKTGHCQAQWYTPYAVQQLRRGMTVILYGKYKSGVLQQPKWTTVDSTMENVYGGQYGVHHNTIRAALVEVLAHVELPDLHNGNGLWHVDTFRRFHFPHDKAEQQVAHNTLKFFEAAILQLALAERRRGSKARWLEHMRHNNHYFHTEIMSHFSYSFTDDQTGAMESIIADMTRVPCDPMQRLIHGEVGSGKTAVAFYAAMLAALNGKRTLILCPTTILAQQHCDTLKGMGWDDVMVYTSDEQCFGDKKWCPIIIGTHALLNSEFLLKSASLIIIDEFQKFGVGQRAKATKHHPHLLLMSATPIPRTLAATVFGDLDVSVIRELPIRRGTVITKWVLPEKREAMYEIIEKELAKGHQAYIVCPRISSEDEDIVAANKVWKQLHERWPKAGVTFLTGKNPPDNKTAVLRDFKNGVSKVMVSTIIAEVGLDCPNATVMVVEGADRFGLSQLHQLRGRVCRSTDTAFCFLVSETSNPTSIARLEVIEKCNDGFEIAEHDLRLRGAGEVFSTRQTGLPDLRWCSLVDDYDLMIEARDLVSAGSVGSGVREMVELKYGKSLELGGVV